MCHHHAANDTKGCQDPKHRVWGARRNRACRAFGTADHLEETMTSQSGGGKRHCSLVDLGLTPADEKHTGAASDIDVTNLDKTLVGLSY